MSRFYVGQRVRIKWSVAWPELAGQEGRIVGLSDDDGIEGCSEWDVAPDCWGTPDAPWEGVNGADWFAPNSRQLEPIQPEGAQPSEFKTLQDLLTSLEGVHA